MIAAAALLLAAADPVAERRCGWIDNPTPSNWWLTDRSGEWLMMAQGGYEAAGMDQVPDLTTSGWVVTNGSSYGYGCGCLTGTFDREAHRVSRIAALVPRPLSQCQADRALPPRDVDTGPADEPRP